MIMFGLKKVFGSNSTKHSFKQGVTAFWDWFPTVSQRFYDTIEAGNCHDLLGETSKVMDQNLPSVDVLVRYHGWQGGRACSDLTSLRFRAANG